jgi:myo-inositol-1(or 4)-monophosphatase
MREPIINIAIEAARAAGNVIVRALDRGKDIKIDEKSHNDFVTEVDRRAEKTITAVIKKAYPKHSILGEEYGEQEGNDYRWIIDPIDGTRNFIHGLPYFAVSIGIAHKNKIEHGVVYDPIRQELFTATRGRGAQLNDRKIRVSTHKKLDTALIGTGFAYRHASTPHATAPLFYDRFVSVCGDIRRAGAAALDLAYVATGRLDGFWECGLKVWDLAAGALLVKEAGGIVTDIEGGDGYMKSGDIVAGNPAILKELLKVIKKGGSS